MRTINTEYMPFDMAFIEFLALILSNDFNQENIINGSVTIGRGIAEEEGKNVNIMIADVKSMNVDPEGDEPTYQVILYPNRIEFDIPFTDKGMKEARIRLRQFVEGMFCVMVEAEGKIARIIDPKE